MTLILLCTISCMCTQVYIRSGRIQGILSLSLKLGDIMQPRPMHPGQSMSGRPSVPRPQASMPGRTSVQRPQASMPRPQVSMPRPASVPRPSAALPLQPNAAVMSSRYQQRYPSAQHQQIVIRRQLQVQVHMPTFARVGLPPVQAHQIRLSRV
jgi:hypothetical protein